MPRFVAKPVEVDAIQFNGMNWDEMQDFTGTRTVIGGLLVPVFTPIGTYLPSYLYDSKDAELWVGTMSTHLAVRVSDWIVRFDRGCYPYKHSAFNAIYERIEGR